MSYEHAHLVRRGERPNVCRDCKREERRAERQDDRVVETHMRFWLIHFGAPEQEVTVLTAAGYVREHGLPPGFVNMVEMLGKEPWPTGSR